MDIGSPPGNLWDFRLARDLLRLQYRAESSYEHGILTISNYDPKSAPPSSLGDFNRLFKHIGLPLDHSISSSSAGSDPPTADYTAPEDISDGVVAVDEEFAGKSVQWKDQVPGGLNLTESRRRSRHASVVDGSDEDDVEVLSTPTPVCTGRRAKKKARKAGGLWTDPDKPPPPKIAFRPASITPRKTDDAGPPPPRFSAKPAAYFEKHVIHPLYTLTQTEQESKLKRKVRKLQANITATPKRMSPASENVHIFLDCSNIIIGLYERLKLDRGMKGSVKAPPVSFKSLAHILERGRDVGRRVLVGSHSALRGSGFQLPAYMKEAKQCDYELNILEPVIKPKVTPSKKARHGLGNGYATTSGHSSGSETFSVGDLARAEQAVDELLQMKMLESLLDSEPGTMVLASGDAAEAEYSGGFLKTVERALKIGWNVEVVAWKNGLSYEYRSTSFLKKWEGRFMVIELDDFSEEMLAMYADVYSAVQDLY